MDSEGFRVLYLSIRLWCLYTRLKKVPPNRPLLYRSYLVTFRILLYSFPSKNTVDPQKERDAGSYVTRQGRATDIISVLDTMTKQLILDDVSWNPRSRSKSSLKEYYLLLLQREREKRVCTSTCVLKICARTVVSVHGQNKGRTTEGRRARNERQEAHLCHSRPPPGALN